MRSRRFAVQLAVIAAIAFTIRVLVILLVDPHVPKLGDASAYHLIANNLADGRGYIRPFDLARFHLVVPTAEYPPLHPFVVSLFSRLGFRSVEWQRICLAVVGTGTVVVIGTLGRRVAGARVGIVAAMIAAVSPMLFLPDVTLMSETVFGFLVALSLLLAVRAHASPTPLAVGMIGVVLGFATLTRAEGALLAMLLVVPLAVRTPGSVARRVGVVALGIAGVVVVVLPWTIRNERTFHQLVPVSNNFGGVLSGANCRLTYSGPSLGSWRSTFGRGDPAGGECFTGFNGHQPGFNEAMAGTDQRRRGVDYAREHVGELPKVAVARVLRTFGLFRPAQQIQLDALEGRPEQWQRWGTWLEWAMYPLAAAGLVILVRRKAPAWPLLAALVSVVVASAATYGGQRFRIGAEPTIVVATATALVALVVGGPRSPTGAVRSRRPSPVE